MTRTEKPSPIALALLVAGCAALFLGGLGRLPLMGRDESLYAEAAREMLATGDWITPRVNGGVFFEKPPLYYWLAAASYHSVGVSPFAARLPAALAALLTIALTVLLGARVWGGRAGLLAGLALATSLQTAFIGRMGIMDLPVTCLTTLALMFYGWWWLKGGLLAAILFGVVGGLGVLLKGAAGLLPFAIAGAHLAISALQGRLASRSVIPAEAESAPEAASSVPGPLCRAQGGCPLIPLTAALVAFCAVAAPWFLIMGDRHGNSFGGTFLVHEHLKRVLEPMQGHGGPFWAYLPVIIFGFFPWVVFLPGAIRPRADQEPSDAGFWRALCLVWVVTVLILFSSIRTKLPGYVTPLFPPMALLVGVELDSRLRRPGRAVWLAAAGVAVLLAVAVSQLPREAARLAPKADAAEAVPLLTIPVVVWAGACLVIALGSLIALAGSPRGGLGVMTVGQAAVIGVVLFGILPVISPYMEGGREYRLAEEAKLIRNAWPAEQRRPLLLYETRPEAVAFVLEEPVRLFDSDQQDELRTELRAGRTLLIAPAEERPFWSGFAPREVLQVGDRILLDVPRLEEPKEDTR